MSLSTRSYSKESRSQYSRSSSYHASSNNGYSSSYSCHSSSDDRPLSTRLIERDSSYPSLAWHYNFDDPFYFDRLRWRFDNDLYNYNYGLGRPIPITYRQWNNYSTRSIPIQRVSSANNVRRHLSYKKADIDDFWKRHDESSMRRENRIGSDDWPPKREPPTRKRSSMTIFIQQPFIDQSEVPYYRQTPRTPTYPNSSRFEYY